MAKCQFENCNSTALKDDPDHYCFWHSRDPDTMEKCAAARLKGGFAKKGTLKPGQLDEYDFSNLKQVDLFLTRAIRMVAYGQINVGVARAIGYLARSSAMIKSQAEFQERLDTLTRRMQELEAK